jgi:Fe2+ transport system protein FeoA
MPRSYATPNRSANENVTPWRNGAHYAVTGPSGDDRGMNSEDEVTQMKREFGARLRRKLAEMGVPEDKMVTHVKDGMNASGTKVRWQTVQSWTEGLSFPLGKNLIGLARFLRVPEHHLVPPMVDADPPQQWIDFKKTPEGVSMNDMERWAVRLFPWERSPTLGDYRQLLALYRANAERA